MMGFELMTFREGGERGKRVEGGRIRGGRERERNRGEVSSVFVE